MPKHRLNTKRIIFLTPELLLEGKPTGGLGAYVGRMASALSARGYDVTVITPMRSDSFVKDRDVSYKVVPLDLKLSGRLLIFCSNILYSLRLPKFGGIVDDLKLAYAFARTVAAEVADGRPAVIQSSDYKAVALFLKLPKSCKNIIRCSGPRRAYLLADGKLDWCGRLRVYIEESALRKADIVFAPSELVAQFYRSRLNRNVLVIRPPALLDNAEMKITPSERKKYFVFYANHLSYRKGADLALHAFSEFCENQSDFLLYCVGNQTDFFKNSLEALSEDVKGKVICSGLLDQNHIFDLISNATAVVLPSRIDNLPNTAIEALMLGVPVVAFRGSSIDELAQFSTQVLLAEPFSVSELSVRMSDSLKITSLGEASFKGTVLDPEIAVSKYVDACLK